MRCKSSIDHRTPAGLKGISIGYSECSTFRRRTGEASSIHLTSDVLSRIVRSDGSPKIMTRLSVRE